jgi:hypothetical protein
MITHFRSTVNVRDESRTLFVYEFITV